MSDAVNAVAAFKQVQKVISDLRTEYDDLTKKINTISAELKALPEKPVPFEDLKAGILELVDTAGERYANEHIKPALIEFATRGHLSMPALMDENNIGKPVKYSQLVDAIEQKLFPMAHGKFVQPSNYVPINDCAFHFFFADLIKDGLCKIMDTLEPADFGYAKIHPDEIGTDRMTRKADIETKQAELKVLYQRRGEIASQLGQLGVKAGFPA